MQNRELILHYFLRMIEPRNSFIDIHAYELSLPCWPFFAFASFAHLFFPAQSFLVQLLSFYLAACWNNIISNDYFLVIIGNLLWVKKMVTDETRICILLVRSAIFIWTMKMSTNLSFCSLLIYVYSAKRRTFRRRF